tara:strand:- start:523 stop:1161 length:639 start_codon:yes stop_codon:yes gene_type:complete
MTPQKTTTKRTRKTTSKKPTGSNSTLKATAPKKAAPIPELPQNPFVYEILEAASNQRSNARKVEVLQKYEDNSVKSILKWNFDDNIVSVLPEGEVPYGDEEEQLVYKGSLSENLRREAAGGESATAQDLDGRSKTSLRKEWQNLYHFVRGGNDTLTKTRREMMFINLLKGLHPREAELLVLVKDKKLEDKYKISKQNVMDAYPMMAQTWRER